VFVGNLSINLAAYLTNLCPSGSK